MQNLFKTVKGHVIQAIGVPAAGVGSFLVISMQDDVFRVLGVTLSNWCLIVSFIYGLFQLAMAIKKHARKDDE
ncbi:hypothetical protein CUZ56_01953 [Saezia sanguinis]|uniref:Uncharacterized protein n=2 Tax=Saezia sanguinis TaxID=1965230 RepID=A0A433SD50_9BURK|nr:hypothetical protein CUZ56_01953 [Saezia sanguinis]